MPITAATSEINGWCVSRYVYRAPAENTKEKSVTMQKSEARVAKLENAVRATRAKLAEQTAELKTARADLSAMRKANRPAGRRGRKPEAALVGSACPTPAPFGTLN